METIVEEIFLLTKNSNITKIIEYIKSIQSDVHNISKSKKEGCFIYKFKKALVLYTDIDHNILFEQTIDHCNSNKNVKERVGQNSDIISKYITFLETLERKMKIEKILKT